MDSIANLFTQLKNAGYAKKKEVIVSYSKLNLAILEILKNKEFISDYKELKNEAKKYPQITVTLKFKNRNELAFSDLKRVSKPGRRIYAPASRIHVFTRGKAEILMSTSQGVMAGADAKKKGLGGEVIGEVV